MATPTCPICGEPAAPRGASRAFPFCSPRCKLLDLGKWFEESYRVPGPPAGDGAEEPGRQPGAAGEEEP